MNRFRAEVDQAVTNAAPMVLEGGKWVPRKTDPMFHAYNAKEQKTGEPLPDDLSIWRFADDAPLRFPRRDQIRDDGLNKHSVLLDTPDDVYEAMVDVYRATGRPLAEFSANRRNLDATVEYVEWRAKAAAMIGEHTPTYLINLYVGYLSLEGRVGYSKTHAHAVDFIPAGLVTTRIGSATISAYPPQLRPGDLDMITTLGFRNVTEVALLAQRYDLPFPQSIANMSRSN
ncbi:MAG TPA: hypothetical protein VLE73_00615 [Candidatus Saccharimonadales bacterium]|nr:hypothetical protein [Candidatus Saccharimonadales bacterium]